MAYVVGKEELDAIASVLSRGRFDRYIDGSKSVTTRFEKEFSEKIGTKHSLAVSSGTAALICGLAGMQVGAGDEVIIPSYTYIATALAVLAVGAIPIIAEIDESLTIDPRDIEKKITSKTKAIIPVHMRGLPCCMSEIMKIAKQYNLLVLEDVAQACGGSFDGKRLGSIGHAGMFSFNHYKNITCGEGGALITNNDELYQRAIIQHHGGYIFEVDPSNLKVQSFAGQNFRLSEIASAMLLEQLKRLDSILDTLRAEKNWILETVREKSTVLNQSPVCDSSGDCGSNIFFQFDSVEQTQLFLKKAKEKNLNVWSSYTRGHVYSDWEPIMEKRGSHHPSRNILDSNLFRGSYHPEMCPKSLDILNRTVGFCTEVNRTRDHLSDIVDEIILTAKEM